MPGVSGRMDYRKFNYWALFLAASLLSIGLPLVIDQVQFYKQSLVATGTVSRLAYGRYHADARFTAVDGNAYTVSVSSIRPFKVDDPVEIRYEPEHPRRTATLNEPLNLWMPTGIFLLFVVLTLYLGFSGKSIRQKGWPPE
jgi:hypothetical protein